jgi:hypothetical protein
VADIAADVTDPAKEGRPLLMDVMATLDLFLIGAACLALWVVARYPSFGPQRVGPALVLVIGAFAVLAATDGLTGTVARWRGAAAALMLVVLPVLTLVFWACARLVRAFVTMLSPFRS